MCCAKAARRASGLPIWRPTINLAAARTRPRAAGRRAGTAAAATGGQYLHVTTREIRAAILSAARLYVVVSCELRLYDDGDAD